MQGFSVEFQLKPADLETRLELTREDRTGAAWRSEKQGEGGVKRVRFEGREARLRKAQEEPKE